MGDFTRRGVDEVLNETTDINLRQTLANHNTFKLKQENPILFQREYKFACINVHTISDS